MKMQYLGDSKDSFKWDYHDFLVSELNYQRLNVVLMLTPDDNTTQGQTDPGNFPAREPILSFCHELREKRNLSEIINLPSITQSRYNIHLSNNTLFTNKNRTDYFSQLQTSSQECMFLDPDNGFEPEKSYSEKHVCYSDIKIILDKIEENSIVSVFQHFRRIYFPNDFKRINERIKQAFSPVYTNMIYWHSLMFVLITKSIHIANLVNAINIKYINSKPNKTFQKQIYDTGSAPKT